MLETIEGIEPMPPIHVDREGRWQWEGREMVHGNILMYLKQHLERDDEGRYWVAVGTARVPLVVEDAPFVVESIDVGGRRMRLDDGTDEAIAPPLTLLSSRDHRLYARVKSGRDRALLSRTAHQRVWDALEQDGGGMCLRDGAHELPTVIQEI